MDPNSASNNNSTGTVAPASNAMPCRTILASTIAKPYVQELADGLAVLGRQPKLVGFLANDDPAARMYADWSGKTCSEIGFDYELRVVDKDVLEEAIVDANEDDNVDGIMIYFPVFGGGQDQYLQQVLSKDKDVEGLSHLYVQNLYHNTRYLDPETKMQKSILPCTPLANVKILEYLGVYNPILPYGNRLFGRTITVVNRSEIVGRPLAALLANDGATVYSVDITGIQKFTRGEGIKLIKHHVAEVDLSLQEVAALSDVIITGVPSKQYKFPTEFIKEGAVCVNFSSEKNFNPEIKAKASLYVPSIGKVTIAMLLRNLLRLINNKQVRLSKTHV
ncbi:tetrahydrofolate dehydrogenase/cyclohydrolase [Nadsonia fulvescens var. elongata DSM 6958]|uniref:Methylenetetrahydrofolate dehydrogenase [NAD(+)] n=1 Tax=Nadsonia fulvescens var. elongata DSM 6958 TaxID=857566 RepID=A0A1E3PR53_9ASCO|nr:tetrahydrofolate dehydrogenase/cyclohydrolase [Nadsonia fulvescens var. elongata DSM 6958]